MRCAPRVPRFALRTATALAAALAACASDPPPIDDAVLGVATTGPGFFFYPPWGVMTTAPRDWAADALPELRMVIEEIDPATNTPTRVVRTLDPASSPRLIRHAPSEGYGLGWNIDRDTITDGMAYRITILAHGTELGRTDAAPKVVPIFRQYQNAHRDLWIKFRVERTAIDADLDGIFNWNEATCEDGLQNGDESGLDCGGSTCEPCAPIVSAIAPSSAYAGEPSMTVSIDGDVFSSISRVYFGDTPLASTLVSPSRLSATIPAALLAGAGQFPISVRNGSRSAAQTFSITYAVPSIAAVDPSNTTADSQPHTFTVAGTRFSSGAVVLFNGSEYPAAVSASTQLSVMIPASHFTSAGARTLAVRNPSPTAGASNAVSIALINPALSVTALNPATALAGGAAFTLSITGSGFANGATATFNGAAVATTFVSTAQLNATIPASAIAASGTRTVRVTNPAPSAAPIDDVENFSVLNPVPVLTAISPSAVVEGSAAFTLTLTGSSFTSGSTVLFGSTALASTFVSAAQLSATVPAALVAAQGTHNIAVVAPAPGGGQSSARTLVVQSSAATGYALSAAPECGSWCYYDEAHNLAASGSALDNAGVGLYFNGQLNDGIRGTHEWNTNLGSGIAQEWVGWQRRTVSITFRFADVRSFSTVTVGMSGGNYGDVQQPYSVRASYSNDGISFTGNNYFAVDPQALSSPNGISEFSTMPRLANNKRGDLLFNISGNSGRYVRLTIEPQAWTFIDEISFGGQNMPAQVGTASNPGASCYDILHQGGSTGDGVYWLNPGGLGAMQVYCDMTRAGGGWALLFNSIGSSAGTTAAFWNINYNNRFGVLGGTALTGNVYNGALYRFAQEYRDEAVDRNNRAADIMLATATGIDPYNMIMVTPLRLSGDADTYNNQFAAGWGSSTFRADFSSSVNCSTYYSNVTQHYGNCWSYNLGSDADAPFLDGGWGPHMATVTASANGFANDGTNYTRMNRISRWVRWTEAGTRISAIGSTEANPGASCYDILLRGGSSGDGNYWIRPNGTAIPVWCDMTRRYGGWALLYNSIGSTNTTPFWNITYANRLSTLGGATPNANVYVGSLYQNGTRYADELVDIRNHGADALIATATGFNSTTMRFVGAAHVSGSSDIYGSQFASGWGAATYDGDAHGSVNCAAFYANVTQHYSNCWVYNLGSDADAAPYTDSNWGPHVWVNAANALGLATDGTGYTRLNRISRWARW